MPGSLQRTPGPFKGARGPLKGPRGPLKGPRGPPRGPLRAPGFEVVAVAADIGSALVERVLRWGSSGSSGSVALVPLEPVEAGNAGAPYGSLRIAILSMRDHISRNPYMECLWPFGHIAHSYTRGPLKDPGVHIEVISEICGALSLQLAVELQQDSDL